MKRLLPLFTLLLLSSPLLAQAEPQPIGPRTAPATTVPATATPAAEPAAAEPAAEPIAEPAAVAPAPAALLATAPILDENPIIPPLPPQARFDVPVEFQTAIGGESLRFMLDALARAVGLTPITNEVPDLTIIYDIGDPKPFRQVWDLVLTLNNLSYILLENDIVVLGSSATVSRFIPPVPPAPPAPPEPEVIPEPSVVVIYPLQGAPENLAALIAAQFLEEDLVTVTPFADNGLLTVRATEAQQAVISDIIARFDAPPPGAVRSVRRVYRLSNAQAADIVRVIQELEQTIIAQVAQATQGTAATTNVPGLVPVGQQPTTAGSTGGGTTAQTVTQQQTRIQNEETVITASADVRTNSVIVSAPAAIQEEIAALIEALDVPQQQVNVQVRIQEVSSTAATTLGINLSAGFGNFATAFLPGGLNFIFDPQRAISGLNIGAVLDTLETQGLSRRIDDTSLMVLNNGTARLTSGGSIEITFAGTAEVQTRTIDFGVIIELSPQIAADGRINLDIAAEVSDLLTPFAEGGIPQRIDFARRALTSRVTIAPGQTILLGGLLQNSVTLTESSIPILGSLPLVGPLFTNRTLTEGNTDLLLVVTANIIE